MKTSKEQEIETRIKNLELRNSCIDDRQEFGKKIAKWFMIILMIIIIGIRRYGI